MKESKATKPTLAEAKAPQPPKAPEPPAAPEPPVDLKYGVWVEMTREGFTVRVLEGTPAQLQALTVKTFLPDIRPVAMGKIERVFHGIMEEYREKGL